MLLSSKHGLIVNEFSFYWKIKEAVSLQERKMWQPRYSIFSVNVPTDLWCWDVHGFTSSLQLTWLTSPVRCEHCRLHICWQISVRSGHRVSFNGGLFLSSSPLEVCAPSSLMTAAANIAIDILSSLRMRCHMAFFARGRKWTQWCSGWLRLGLWWIYLFIWMKTEFCKKTGQTIFRSLCLCVLMLAAVKDAEVGLCRLLYFLDFRVL